MERTGFGWKNGLRAQKFDYMKKTQRIKLVLITAALASCNRQLVPRPSFGDPLADSTLTAAPAAMDSDSCANGFNECCEEVYSQMWNYSFNPFFNFYFSVPVGHPYYPGGVYRKGAFWRQQHFIHRGGWGKSGSVGS
jgi:hypothetical protein